MTDERQAVAIQAVAELSRGLDVMDAELRRGDFTGARDSIRTMRALVSILDRVVPQVHVNDDQATTGQGDPLSFLTGSNWPKPCLRCGSRQHVDCYQRSIVVSDPCDCDECWRPM